MLVIIIISVIINRHTIFMEETSERELQMSRQAKWGGGKGGGEGGEKRKKKKKEGYIKTASS